ncbi:MAG: hypothetical protein JSS81_13995 [Acidobacteria bacterium]|nr:hypothetical protein [Acidobacteriota bacterium]
MRINFLLLFGLLQFNPEVSAQYRFDRWTTDNGLPQNSVYSIQQTADGYLWLTTLDGLVRFDGVRFTVFSKADSPNLPSNRFIKLLADDEGETIFAGTDEVGLVRRQNGEFRTFTVADGLPANGIHDIQKDADGSILITTHGGAARLRRDGSLTVEREQSFREFKIYLAPSGARWELDAGGLRKIRDGQTTHFDLPFEVKPGGYELGFVPLFEDREGALWLPYEGRIYRFKDGAISVFARPQQTPASAVRSIAEDRAGNVWFGTEKEGACRLAENRFECFTTADGLSSNFIHSIFLDREKTLWFGTNEGGLDRLTDRVVSPLSVRDGLVNENVYPLLETRAGDVWIGTFGGLSHYENGKITNYTKREGLLYDAVQSLYRDETGRLWIGSVGGVQFLENGKFTDFTRDLNFKIGETDFWDIHRDRHGTLWFATRSGLIKFAGGTATRLTTADGLPHNNVKIIDETRSGELWIGTDNGLAKISESGVEVLGGLAGKSVRTIYEDADGTVWIGTYEGGLTRLKNGTAPTNYTAADGLFSNGVFAIIEDRRGNFWMSSNQGIYRVARRELEDFADGKIKKITSTAYGKSDGMLNVECNGGRQPAGFRAADGRLWFPTQDGIAIINPDSVPFNPNPPPVVIESVKIDNLLAETPAANGSGIVVSPDQNNLEIAYTGLSFIKPEQIRFRYRIENLDANWTEAGTRRTAYFSRLPPGEFTFRVAAANSDNVWNEQGAAIRIVVLPPFYRTWWFTALTVLGLAAAGVLLYRFRVDQIKRKYALETAFSRKLIDSQERERKRFAAEMHDGLGQSFVIIKNRARLSLKQIDNEAATLDHLEKISETASQALEETREIAFNLRPHLLDRLGLTKTIESMIDKVSSASGIEFETTLDPIDGLLDKDSEILLYRIVQEAVSNIVKHSEAAKATVTVEHRAAQIKLQISDDGRGFDAAGENDLSKGGFGLVGIAERTRLLNGRMRVEAEAGKGTLVSVEINLRK